MGLTEATEFLAFSPNSDGRAVVRGRGDSELGSLTLHEPRRNSFFFWFAFRASISDKVNELAPISDSDS